MESDNKMVEAIEEGKIVKVDESYAIREGLPIIRKPQYRIGNQSNEGAQSKGLERPSLSLKSFRKPLDWQKNKVVKELVPNFHWEILKRRRVMNVGRRQFASAIGESEECIKLLENGILERDDFILINKVQNYLGINLRKDGVSFGQEMRKLIESDSGRDSPDAMDLDSGVEDEPRGKSRMTLNEKEVDKNVNEILFSDDIQVID